MRIRLAIILVVLGGMAAYYGVQEWRLAASASATPQEISLKDLIARGPGDNAHILLKEFIPCDNYIYSKKENNNNWDEVWVPVIPPDALPKLENLKLGPGALPLQQQIAPGNVQAIIKSTHIHNETELERLEKQPTLQGMVVNKISSIGSEEKTKLIESYPGTDFNRCLIIEDGRTPAGMGLVVASLGGGGVLVLVGIGLALLGLLRR